MEQAYKTFSISSFKEYQDIILSIPSDQLTLYRGQPFDKTLLPKIARYNVKHIEQVEKEMLEDFKRRSLHLMQYHPRNTWDWLALAQHHGLATRLLDWSANPLIALWFSMAPEVDPDSKAQPVVWGFHAPEEDIVNSSDHIDPFEGGHTKIFKPNHITKRIPAQFAWFTIHKINSEKRFVPFEENTQYADKLFKIKVQRECIVECKKRLHTFGINSATMYPDIDGLARHVEWLFLGDRATSLTGSSRDTV